MTTARQEHSELAVAIGRRLRAERHARNLPLKAVADVCGTTKSAVSYWERGLALPTTDKFVALAQRFGFDLADLPLVSLPPASGGAVLAGMEPSGVGGTK